MRWKRWWVNTARNSLPMDSTSVMIVLGIDFTSSPRKANPITCLSCTLDDEGLRAGHLKEWRTFDDFECALAAPGPWIAGIDFPFGQARKFIEGIGWPRTWTDYVRHAHRMGRNEFRHNLDKYRASRPDGDKEHRRKTDVAAGSISPQKLYGVPVGLMFFEGASRLIEAKVTIPGLQVGDENRIVVEAYPGFLTRKLIGRQSYKNDSKRKQTGDQATARHNLLSRITSGELTEYGFRVETPAALADDPTGDHLMHCCVQFRQDGHGHNDGAATALQSIMTPWKDGLLIPLCHCNQRSEQGDSRDCLQALAPHRVSPFRSCVGPSLCRLLTRWQGKKQLHADMLLGATFAS